jgi:hypothetical protein
MLFFPFIGISQNTQAGTDIMETIITSGSNATGSSGSVTYSIGQVFYTYMGESVYTVAQGVQQQESEENLGTPEVETPKTEILVYPNPTTDFVNINTEGFELNNTQQSYRLYDIQGRLLQQNKIEQTQTQVSLNNLSSSIYLLVIYVDNKLLKTFKILKK